MKYLFIVLISIGLSGCLTSGMPVGSYHNGNAKVFDTRITSKIKKDSTKQDVIKYLGQSNDKNIELNKGHVQRYAKRYIGYNISLDDGIYELWKYGGSKTSHQMGLVGGSYRTIGRHCLVVFNNDDLVEYFNCK